MNRTLIAVVIAGFFLVRANIGYAQGRTLTSEGYTLVVPQDWEVVEEAKTVFTVRAPKDDETDTFGENIRVVRHSVGKSYTVSEVLRRQKSDTGRFKLIGEGTMDGSLVPMVWMAMTPKSPKDDNDALVKIDFITTRGTDIFVLVAMAKPDVWQAYLPKFKEIAATFAPLSSEES